MAAAYPGAATAPGPVPTVAFVPKLLGLPPDVPSVPAAPWPLALPRINAPVFLMRLSRIGEVLKSLPRFTVI